MQDAQAAAAAAQLRRERAAAAELHEANLEAARQAALEAELRKRRFDEVMSSPAYLRNDPLFS